MSGWQSVNMGGGWMLLEFLPDGAIFETRDGCRAVKSEYNYPNGQPECVLLASGEYAHFPEGGKTLVRELHIWEAAPS